MDNVKYDHNKMRLAKVPPEAIEAIGTIMTHGIEKYSEDGWMTVEPYRYRDALMRHICEYLRDPYGIDIDSGYPHMWHIITNCAFLCYLEKDDYASQKLQGL